ncbi:MAG: aspartate carbamoyltransferase, partial [Candidatus Omnitrophica bacterium]|nr:aspartate carbamoyltransferase [Candidatus Omnitrophota bacterium]
VTVCGPSTLVPPEIESLGATINYDIRDVIRHSDVLMPLRVQMERQQQKFLPSLREYAKEFGIDKKKLELAKKDVIIMHPGPTNRGLEISAEVADGQYSVILNQVTNGVAVRMAVLYLLLGTKGKEAEEK